MRLCSTVSVFKQQQTQEMKKKILFTLKTEATVMSEHLQSTGFSTDKILWQVDNTVMVQLLLLQENKRKLELQLI